MYFMLFSDDDLFSVLSFTKRNNHFYGKIDNCWLVFEKIIGKDKTVFFTYLSVNTQSDCDFLINNLKSVDSIKNIHKIESYLVFDIDVSNINIMELSGILSQISEIFDKGNYQSVCFYCNSEKPVNFSEHYDRINPIGNICKQSHPSLADMSITNAQYFFAFIFSVFGALIGSILWIVIGYFGFYASIAGFIIAIGAYYGYSQSIKRVSSFGIAILIISVSIAVIFSQYILIIINSIKYINIQKLKVPIDKILFFSFKSLFEPSSLLNITIGLAFAFIGSFRFVFSKRKEKDSLLTIL
jgi:hypothetical protein